MHSDQPAHHTRARCGRSASAWLHARARSGGRRTRGRSARARGLLLWLPAVRVALEFRLWRLAARARVCALAARARVCARAPLASGGACARARVCLWPLAARAQLSDAQARAPALSTSTMPIGSTLWWGPLSAVLRILRMDIVFISRVSWEWVGGSAPRVDTRDLRARLALTR